MYFGVPQRFVLGLLLWYLECVTILLVVDLPVGVSLTCYADDTLVLVVGGIGGLFRAPRTVPGISSDGSRS